MEGEGVDSMWQDDGGLGEPGLAPSSDEFHWVRVSLPCFKVCDLNLACCVLELAEHLDIALQ